MGGYGDTAELADDVWVPDSQLLGEPHRGFYATMQNFQNERWFWLEWVSGYQAAIDMTTAYTQERKAFGGKLFDLEQFANAWP